MPTITTNTLFDLNVLKECSMTVLAISANVGFGDARKYSGVGSRFTHTLS
jgi:hypothetical protein